METTTAIFKSELLENFANELKAEGMKIYYSPYDDGRKTSYFYFTDGQNIGYCQDDYFGGLTFSTVHKPCRECGTGFRMGEGDGRIFEPTVKDAKKAFAIAPHWANLADRKAVKKWANIDEFLKKETILKYVEY